MFAPPVHHDEDLPQLTTYLEARRVAAHSAILGSFEGSPVMAQYSPHLGCYCWGGCPLDVPDMLGELDLSVLHLQCVSCHLQLTTRKRISLSRDGIFHLFILLWLCSRRSEVLNESLQQENREDQLQLGRASLCSK